MLNQMLRFGRDESGPTAVEYAVMLALILVVVITAINALGDTSSGYWANDATQITTALAGS